MLVVKVPDFLNGLILPQPTRIPAFRYCGVGVGAGLDHNLACLHTREVWQHHHHLLLICHFGSEIHTLAVLLIRVQ